MDCRTNYPALTLCNCRLVSQDQHGCFAGGLGVKMPNTDNICDCYGMNSPACQIVNQSRPRRNSDLQYLGLECVCGAATAQDAIQAFSRTSSPSSGIHFTRLEANISKAGLHSLRSTPTESANRPNCRHLASGSADSMMQTGLPHSAHIVLCMGRPEPVSSSTKILWGPPAGPIGLGGLGSGWNRTFCLGTTKAYDATPPLRRLHDMQWQVRVGKEARGLPVTVTCRWRFKPG